MTSSLSGLLSCPLCRSSMDLLENGSLGCDQGHRYDAAKQGYFNLLTGRGTNFRADTAEMVRAREDFLSAGHYAVLAETLAATVQRFAPVPSPTVVDAGAGTGYYLQAVRRLLPDQQSVALDISKYALRRCARTTGRPLSLVWDIWQRLPLQDAAADMVLNVFAPRNLAEFRRILHPEGRLVVVTPLPGHLQELREAVGMLDAGADKADSLRRAAEPMFEEIHSAEITYPMTLGRADAVDAVLMGPSSFHTTAAEVEAAAANLKSLPVTAQFCLQVFRAAEPAGVSTM